MSEAQGSERSLARSSAAMAAGTAVSRLLGFLRTALLLGIVGTGLSGDAFDVANTLPNQFYLLLAGGVLNAVLVPQITKAATHDDGGHDFVNRLLTLSLTVVAAATLVVTALAPLLVRLFSQGWDSRTIALSTAFALICLPQVFFYGLYTVLGQVLNARGQFAAYMWAPALANIVAVGGLVWFAAIAPHQPGVGQWTGRMVWVLAGTATLGVVLQSVALVIPLRRGGFRFRPVWGFRGVGLRSASRVALWTFAALAVSQLGFVVTSRVLTRANDLMTASGVVGAGKAAYSGAFLLFMLPHSLITLSLVTALFTRMSTAAHAGDTRAVVDDLGRGLRMPAVLLVPGTVAAVLLGTAAARLVFFRNTDPQAHAIAAVMIAMMLGLLPFGWLYLIQRVYYAYEDARTPFFLQLVVTGVATAVNITAFFVDPARAGVLVGIGQTASNLVAAALGFWLLRRRFGLLRLRTTTRLYVRLVAASVAGALVAWPVIATVGRLGLGRFVEAPLQLAVGGSVFLAVVLGLAHLMRVQEVDQLLDPVLRRLRRRPPTSPAP
ncbi:MAG TPA: murein biosynthesis integral membrane protein MurJ [Pedococcus sp.]|jgi:putative peptidoglycan lipid II flippase|nr:murein biosynthesis integral membrane protein MurJ [Pedococcus sp.]